MLYRVHLANILFGIITVLDTYESLNEYVVVMVVIA
jgi:hypothetical protein